MFPDRAVPPASDLRFHHTLTSSVAQGNNVGLVIIFFLIVCFVSVIFIIRVLYSTPFLPPFLSSLPWFFVVFFFFLFYLQVFLAELRPAAVLFGFISSPCSPSPHPALPISESVYPRSTKCIQSAPGSLWVSLPAERSRAGLPRWDSPSPTLLTQEAAAGRGHVPLCSAEPFSHPPTAPYLQGNHFTLQHK